MPLQLTKCFFLITYLVIHLIIPGVGVPWDFAHPTIFLLQNVLLAILGLFLFYQSLLIEWQNANKKKIGYFSALFVGLMIATSILLARWLQVPLSVSDYSERPAFAFSALFIAPLIEELAYRYSFNLPYRRGFKGKDVLTKIWSLTFLLLSSYLFAFGHLAAAQYNLFLLIPFLVMGLALGLIYWITDNIWYSILAHYCYNLVVLFLSLLLN